MKLRNFKKLSLALVLGMILSVFAPLGAMAAEVEDSSGEGKITLENPKPGVEYTLYRIFDLKYNEDNGSYAYTPAKESFVSTLQQGGYGVLLKNVGDGKYEINADMMKNVEEEGFINAYDFSNWVYNQTEDLVLRETKSTDEENGTLEWANLPLGYYMIRSNAGTVVSLDSTDKEAKVKEKNPDQTILGLSKQVKLDTENEDAYADFKYANIGEVLNYKITFNVNQYANKEYTLTDPLPQGIEYVDGFTVDGVAEEDGEYTVDPASPNSETGEFTVTIPEKTIRAIAEKAALEDDGMKLITITYKAKLNNDASISNHIPTVEGSEDPTGNTNTASLKYDQVGEDEKIVSDGASVYTTDFNIHKIDQNEKNLSGAEFKIYTSEEGTDPITFDENYYVNPTGDTDTVVSNDDGMITLTGLKPGSYFIEETKAPEGYNLMAGRSKITITGNDDTPNQISYTGDGVENNTISIENNTGNKLPDTGGMGRTLIYTIGGIVFFVALVGLVSRNKNKGKQA